MRKLLARPLWYIHDQAGWYKTLCKECAIKNEYPIVEEDEG